MSVRAFDIDGRTTRSPLPADACGGAAPAAPAPAAEDADPRRTDWTPALDFLEPGGRFLLTTHVNPDGDGLGCQSALARALERRGCEAWIVNADPVPEIFLGLFDGLEERMLVGDALPDGLPAFDGAVILDVSALKRCGSVAPLIERLGLPTLVLDHHLSNDLDGGLVYAFPKIGSTGEVLASLLDAAGVPLDERIATALYTSIVTDSGGFSFASTTAETLDLAARLVRAGADPCAIDAAINQQYPSARYALLADFLARREERCGGRLQVFELTRKMYEESGAGRQHSEGFANIGLGIRGCLMTLIFSDLSEDETKVNLRCKAPCNVCELARPFGGGGHRFASGATVAAPLAEIRGKVIAAAEAQIAALEGAWDA